MTGSATVLASANPGDGGTSGNIEFWNNGTLSPVIPGVLLVADRDLHVRNELRASGFLGAGESFWIQSNLFLPQASGGGSLISRGLPDTAGSLLRTAPGGTASTGCQQNVGNQICNVLEISYAAPPGVGSAGAFTVSSWQEL